MLKLQVAGHVRFHSQNHGGVVILDTAQGEWLALNATAGDFWRAWGVAGDFEEGLRMVVARYPHVPPEELRTDAERLVGELTDRRLLTIAVASVNSASPQSAVPMTTGGEVVMAEAAVHRGLPQPGWVRVGLALCVLAGTCLIVRCSSFRLQLALVRTARRLSPRVAAWGEAATTVTAVDRASRRYPGRAACLERSLAAVFLSAAAGRRLDWCLGALADPYRFHAWVEAEGRTVPAPTDPHPSLRYVRLFSA